MFNKFKEIYESMEFGEKTAELEEFLSWLTQKLSTEEAKELCDCLLPERKQKQEEDDNVIYTHNCHGSAKHHKGKYKHWCKLVDNVDTNKTNGYAFAGDFLSLDSENLVPLNSVVVEVCGNDYTAYKIIDDNEKEEVASGVKRNLVTFIRKVADYV